MQSIGQVQSHYMRWNVLEFAPPHFSWSRRCNCHRKNSLLYSTYDENVIETREFVQFGNEGFTKSFVSATVRDLDNNFVALFASLFVCRGGH